MNSDIENLKWVFEIEDHSGIRGNVPVYSLIPRIKNYQIAKPLCYFNWFYERKN